MSDEAQAPAEERPDPLAGPKAAFDAAIAGHIAQITPGMLIYGHQLVSAIGAIRAALVAFVTYDGEAEPAPEPRDETHASIDPNAGGAPTAEAVARLAELGAGNEGGKPMTVNEADAQIGAAAEADVAAQA